MENPDSAVVGVKNGNGNLKVILPQVLASVVASLTHIPLMGVSMGYSAVLITQMEECRNGIKNCSDAIYMTETESSWIASIFPISIPVGALISSTLMDTIGRLNLLILAVVPGVIGWGIIALATNTTMLLVGRIISGIAGAWSTCSALVYIPEITSPKLRGSLGGLPTVNVSLGIVLVYVLGYFVHWRAIAWCSVAFSIISATLMIFLPKSPAWLVSKGRIDQAEKSLNWINKYHSNCAEVTKNQLALSISVNEAQQQKTGSFSCSNYMSKFGTLLEGSVYKPLLILAFLNILVQFSGVYVIVYYATALFQAAGTNINPYFAAICFGVARFIASLFATGLLRRFGRRPLMVCSGLGMAVSMSISALFTYWIQKGTSTQMWVPLVMIVVYVIATMVGFLVIPLSIPAELFPTAVRGMAQSITIGILFGLSFGSTFSYYALSDALGGSSGLQFFYAGTSLLGVIYTYVLLPETYKKNLHEIELYFKHNTVYLLYKLRSEKVTGSKENII